MVGGKGLTVLAVHKSRIRLGCYLAGPSLEFECIISIEIQRLTLISYK